MTSAADYQHPAFPQPANPSVSLWRYMSMDKFEWLLSERRLFMPAATQLGDPFEGTTPQGELNWWKHEEFGAASEEQREIIAQNRAKISAFARAFQRHYYVSCWHMNEHENHAMWGLYTRDTASVAIRTTLPILRDCLPRHVDIGLVRYIDYATERLPTMNMLECIMHKRIHFSFEQEIRAVACGVLPEPLGGSDIQQNLFELTATPSFRVYAPQIEVGRLVQCVVMHPKATAEFADEVAVRCTESGLSPPEPSKMNQTPAF